MKTIGNFIDSLAEGRSALVFQHQATLSPLVSPHFVGGSAWIRPLTRDVCKRPICRRWACSQSSRIAFDLPELLDIQRASFNKFVRYDIPDLFSQLAPIRVEEDDMAVELHLNGNNFQLIAPDDSPQDCIFKLKTYSCKLYIEAKIVYKTIENKILYSTQSEWVLIGHLPLMTKRGHFIINGSPRVIVHQVVRSPGIYFQQVLDKDEKQRIRFYGDIIPRRGVWLRLQTTKKGKIEAKLKKGKKVSADMLQKCLQFIERFERERSSDCGLNKRLALGRLTPTRTSKFAASSDKRIQSIIPPVSAIFHNGYVPTPAALREKEKGNADALDTLTANFQGSGTSVKALDNINAFKNAPEEKALLYTYDKLYRPVEDKEREEISKRAKNSSVSNNTLTDRRLKLKRCYKNIFSTFKEKGRYDLSSLGREKINIKLGIYVPANQLTALDIYAASSWLYQLTKGEKKIDDIDHFQNRRIRTSGELLYAQFENGVDRLRRLTWNKLKKFVHLQAVQTTFLDLKDSRKSSAEIVQTREKNNGTTSFLRSQPEQKESDNKINALSAHLVNGTKSDLQTTVLRASLPPSQSELRAIFSSKPGSKDLPLLETFPDASRSKVEAARSNLLLKRFQTKSKAITKSERLISEASDWIALGNHFSQTSISLTENFPVLKNQKAEKERYHIRNTRHADSAPLLKILIKQRHLLWKFGFLARRRWLRQLKTGSLSQSHTNRSVKILDSKKSIFVKKLLSANSNKSNSASMIQAKLALPLLKEFLSTKPLNGALRELFGSNPLSQYMDQTNPLAEITHKRRMSSLGVGGVSRESAGMAIRGIHPTHYGRICPIETPEGKNAGLVNSLAFYARIDNKGFVETPYYKVVKGQVQHELGFTFFSAKKESANNLNIAPSDLQQSWSNMLATDSVPVRVADNLLDIFKKIDSYQVDCIGIAPVQMISVATSLIPFLEHNDANRALMGSNMQRQAVPLMIPERAIVGTGLESLVVAESGHLVQSELTGFISYVSANRIVVDSLCCAAQNVVLSNPNFKKVLKNLAENQKKLACAFSNAVKAPLITKSQNPKIRRFANPTSPLGDTKGDGVSKSDSLLILNPKIAHTHLKVKWSTTFSLNKNKNRFGQANFLVDNTGNAYRHGQVFSGILPLAAISGWPLRSNKFSTLNQSKSFAFVKTKTNAKLTNVCYSVSKTAFTQASVYQNTFRPVQKRYSQVVQRPLYSIFKNSNCGQAKASSLPANTCFQSMWYSTTRSKTAHQLTSFVHVVNNFDRSNQDTCLTQRALVKEGNWVQKGDILTDCSASDQGELAVGKNILVAYIPWEGYNFEDAIVISERLVKEHVYTSLHIERYDFNAQDVKEGSEWFTNDLPGIPSTKVKYLDEFGLPKIGSFVKEGDILIGKIRYSNIKPTTPYERLLCDILGENNFSARDSSLYVPKGVHARVIKRKILTYFDDPAKMRSKRDKSPKLVHIFLGEKRVIQVGDKMSGRHGNKGVVATILPRQDMPYLADGTPIDIILNPLGVPSRMNVGQVFESLLGLAGTYLAQHFKIMSFDELYGVEASQSLVYLKLYQARLQSGQNWLFQVDFPGKTRLIDGRSGQCFDQWITVGKAYMLKLIHMVNEKIHARATGPYALITQQPLRGRSQKGGQRLGEMEVWALEGFGAAYTLQELLTKKSDDMVGRKEVASAILPRPISILDIVEPAHRAQENRFILGQPEIFKVLICELQALCLDVGVYSLTTESFQRSFLSKVNYI
uniref:RNA polymerase beta subunit n=1 Tax=Phyllosiphon coccidium TaxID=1837062 RepID=UPI0024117A14|nr:RNA polymerase beta subunit [Phyllosiphon coccidium]WDY12736.1 RNA polymerase beta subunit [Phyllosiphon coccidium]